MLLLVPQLVSLNNLINEAGSAQELRFVQIYHVFNYHLILEQAVPAIPAAALVVNRHPPARSPTPPTRVIKSTYGGNLFTADDIMYLKKYIDYCQDQGLVLRLVHL